MGSVKGLSSGPGRELSGSGSADAGLVHGADAQCVDGTVEVSFDVAAKGGTTQLVKLRLTREVAREFALKLVRCAAAVSAILLCLVDGLDNAPVRQAQRTDCRNVTNSTLRAVASELRNEAGASCGLQKPGDFVGLRRRAVSPHAPQV